METIFVVLLGVGVVYAVVGFLLGEFLGHGDTDVTQISPFKPAVIAAFIIVFGGTGLIFLQFFPPLVAVPLAGLSGAAVAFLIFQFIIVPLTKAQNTTAIEIQSLVGHQAKVTEKIFQGKYGKITYVVNDSTYTAPAKSQDGNEIPRNTTVEIIYIENNTYYVRVVA
ncbi:MAG: NfeD family protein [Turicibacter sp.]|nr:NfeD family protein [Turicibacter sp.]